MTKDAPKYIPCPVREAAVRAPDSIALASPGKTLTYRELDGAVSLAARNIRENNLAGERVGVYVQKGVEEVALVFALVRSGSVAAMIPTRIPPPEVPNFLRRAGCTALITDEPKAISGESPTFSPDGFFAGEPGTGDARIRPSRPATIVFTSGSTGTPKAALHTLGNHLASAAGSAENIPLSAGDVWLHSLPLFHVGGLSILFRCIVAGATIALPEPGDPVGEAIRKSGATHVSLVATQLRRLLDGGEHHPRVKAILLGGSGIPEDLLDRAYAAGLPVHTSYGLTEMASQVTTTAPNASREELGTSGWVLPGRELRISGEGEILVKGATLFSGYINPDGTPSLTDDDGWFHTKDLGYLDDGLLTVTGRLDNRFISGGENIQPEEIEEALRRVAGIEDAVVVPVPDDEFGERPVAFLKREPLGESPGDISATLRETLPGFKVPVAYYGWPEDAPGGMKVDRGYFRRRATRLRG